ncbi:hypothetical protein GCM10027566_19450 [Arachidicoccus ginsenosidivorans]
MDVLPQSVNTWVGSITNTTKLLGEDFSYGLRFSQNQILNDDSTYDNSTIPLQLLASQKISYKETNYAAFTSWQKQVKNLFIQLGLRIENNKIDSRSDSLNGVVNYNWFNVFPNLLFQYSKTASSYWILSFNKSFKRPDYSLLNPYQRLTDNSSAKFEGNTHILPQKNFDISLGWTNNNSITVYSGFLIYKDMISTLYLKDPSFAVLYQKYDNFYLQGSYLTATYAINIKNWWRSSFDGYGLFYKTKYKQIKPGRTTPLISLNLTNDFTVNSKLQLGINAYFKPTYSDGYYTHYQQGNINIALTRKLGKEISISIFGNDLFKNDGYKEKALYDIYYKESGYMDSRQVGISILWKFGKQNLKNRKINPLESDASKNRL